LSCPEAREENIIVLEAVSAPKYGEEEALKVCIVPLETMARGPLAEKVWVAPVNPPREVMPPLPAPAQVPSNKRKHPPVSLIPLEKVEVAIPVTAR